MPRTRYLLTALVAVVVLGGCVLYLTVRNGLTADRSPGRLETMVARRLVVLSIPAAMRNMKNPYADDPASWRSAADHFQEHCAVCHGADGRASSEFAREMYPPVPDFQSPDVQRLSDGALFAIIQNGVRWTGMPAFRSEHTVDETWQLVSLIRHVRELKPDQPQTHEHASDSNRETVVHRIDIDGTAFVPAETVVHVGETVSWNNKDPFPHNIVSAEGGFKSNDMDPGGHWEWRPGKPGRFPYLCTLHPGMSGTLIVNPEEEGEPKR